MNKENIARQFWRSFQVGVWDYGG